MGLREELESARGALDVLGREYDERAKELDACRAVAAARAKEISEFKQEVLALTTANAELRGRHMGRGCPRPVGARLMAVETIENWIAVGAAASILALLLFELWRTRGLHD